MKWLDRLPPDYKRRYYTNRAFLIALFAFVLIISRLKPRNAAFTIEALLLLLVAWSFVWPLIRLLQTRSGPIPFVLYAAWILASAYVGTSFFIPTLPAAGLALVLGFILMCAFYAVCWRIVFPSFFGGTLRTRWSAIRQAQKAEREARIT